MPVQCPECDAQVHGEECVICGWRPPRPARHMEPAPPSDPPHSLTPEQAAADRAKFQAMLSQLKAKLSMESPTSVPNRKSLDESMAEGRAAREKRDAEYERLKLLEYALMGDKEWLARWKLGLPVPDSYRLAFERDGIKRG